MGGTMLPQLCTMLPQLCTMLPLLCTMLPLLCTTLPLLCIMLLMQFTTLPTMLSTTCPQSTTHQLTMVFASWLTLSPMQWPTPLPTMQWPTTSPTICLTLSCTLLQSSTAPPTASLPIPLSSP